MSRRIVICGKAASGKDFLRNAFAKQGYSVDISVTTRPRREGEVDGETYHYLDKIAFQTLVDTGQLFEHVWFNGWGYGTLMDSWKHSQVFIMNAAGVRGLSEHDRAQCIVVYLDIPLEVRRKRLEDRSDADSASRRIAADEVDFEGFKEYDLRIFRPDFPAASIVEDWKILSTPPTRSLF